MKFICSWNLVSFGPKQSRLCVDDESTILYIYLDEFDLVYS